MIFGIPQVAYFHSTFLAYFCKNINVAQHQNQHPADSAVLNFFPCIFPVYTAGWGHIEVVCRWQGVEVRAGGGENQTSTTTETSGASGGQGAADGFRLYHWRLAARIWIRRHDRVSCKHCTSSFIVIIIFRLTHDQLGS